MKLVKTNQDLIVGRKYLCRTKPIKVQNGSFTTPELSILHVGEDQGRRYVGPSKFWAYDQHDGIISWNGKQRLEAEAMAMNLPVSEMSVIPEDYEVNSQALERWEMIGPIPDVKEGILHLLFDHPEILPFLQETLSVNVDGSINVSMKSIDTDEEHFMPAVVKETIYTISDEASLNDFKLANNLVPVEAVNETAKSICENIEVPMVQSAMNNKPQFQRSMLPESMFIRYNPQEMIGKYVRLTENKYTQLGYFPKGTILLIAEFNDGFLLKEEKSEIVIIGVDDGFEFIEFGYKEEPKPITLNIRDISIIDQYVSMALGNIKSENSYLNNGFQVFGQSGMGMGPNGVGLPNVTKEEKIAFLEAYINRLKNV